MTVFIQDHNTMPLVSCTEINEIKVIYRYLKEVYSSEPDRQFACVVGFILSMDELEKALPVIEMFDHRYVADVDSHIGSEIGYGKVWTMLIENKYGKSVIRLDKKDTEEKYDEYICNLGEPDK